LARTQKKAGPLRSGRHHR